MTQQRALYISVIELLTTTRLWKHKYWSTTWLILWRERSVCW